MLNTVRYTAMMLYELANVEQIPAKKMDFIQLVIFLLNKNLRKELEIGREWRWGDGQ